MRPTTLSLVALIIASTSPSTAQTTETQIKSQQTLQIDPLNGALIVDVTDSIGRNYNLHRRYSSRSLYRGLYGVGWCSDLDIKIQIRSTHTIDLYNCDTTPTTFTYNVERSRYETLPSVNSASLLWLDRRGVRGYRLFDNRAQQKQIDFDTAGRPIQIDHFVIQYPSELEIELHNPDTNLALIITLQDNHITRANLTHSIAMNYEYSDQRLTRARATNASTAEFNYQYDDAANLVSATESRAPRGPASLATSITYTDDLVTQVESGPCTQTINYITPANTDVHTKSVSIQTACRNQPTTRKTYEFNFHIGTNDIHILDNVKIKGDNT